MANDLKEKEYNPSQDDYKDKFDSDLNSGGSTGSSGHGGEDSSANMSHNSSNPDLGKREAKPDKNEDSSLAEQQAKDEGVGDSNLYDPSGAQQHHKPSTQARLKNMFSGRKKYGWIGGGIAGALVGGLLLFFPVLGPVHILSNLVNFNFDYNDSFRRQRTGTIVDSILNRNREGRSLRKTPFTSKADLIAFEKFESRMVASGWTFEYNADRTRATGLIDPDGNRVGLDNTSRAEFNRRVQPLIDDSIPAWRMNKRTRTRQLISTFSGPRRAFSWTSLFSPEARESEDNFVKRRYLKEAGLDRVETGVDSDVRQINQDGSEVDSDLTEAQRTVLEELDNGATKAEALNTATEGAVSKYLSPDGRGVAITTVALVASCLAYAAYQNDLIADFSRQASSIRIGATLMSGVNEIQQGGDIDIGEVGQFFNEYNNNEESFANSAAWQRATGQHVTGPELDPELHVIENTGDDSFIETSFESAGVFLANVPEFLIGPICDFVNSAFFAVLGLIIDVAETIVGCIGSAGTACAAMVAKSLTLEGMFEFAGRMIAASIVNVAGFIIEDPVQALAAADQGLNMIASDESRTGVPVDNDRYNQSVQAYLRDQNSQKSASQRYLAIDNPHSLFAGLARAKMNLSDLNPTAVIASLFRLPGNALVAVTNSQNVYAQTDVGFDNYGFQKYSYSNDYFDDNPFVLAEQVTDLIEADQSIYLDDDNGKYARDFAVMCMGYVPEQGVVDKSPLNASFLPRYSDPETSDAESRNAAFEVICLDKATENEEMTGLYAKVGRFVDDIELISSIIELTGESVPTTTSGGEPGGAPTGGAPTPDPTPTPPEVCGPNTAVGGICID